ncbi:hypothetical protein A2U01_0099349, partial [Trifolium medium]|nr:hypothetical protein [Trifolium medium]
RTSEATSETQVTAEPNNSSQNHKSNAKNDEKMSNANV